MVEIVSIVLTNLCFKIQENIVYQFIVDLTHWALDHAMLVLEEQL